jgi:DNA replication protein DnaC
MNELVRQTSTLLKTLNLKGIERHLDELLEESEDGSRSPLAFLHEALTTEVSDRKDRRLRRNLAAAHFPVEKRLETFSFDRVEGISEAEVLALHDFRWVDKTENVLFFGPPGLGKTHLSIALGLEAVHAGYTVCFERMSNLVKLLKTSEIQRASAFRIRRILSSHVLIIDEIGYIPIDRKEANLFFNLVSELYERSAIIVTSNKHFDAWSEMMGDEVMTSAMLDRLLHHAHIFSLAGESYRLESQRKESELPTLTSG